MKIQALANPLVTSNNMASSSMGMDAAGADMATFYLRDKIYSDKILAVVREYVCNALDEHKKHNISVPVDFGIRNTNEDSMINEFFVRDYAAGLSEYDIRNVFGMYFRSTKSNSNNQIGGFGVGSKAGHCYTDTFYIKSHFNNVCTMYVCALGGGSTGVPVGQILKVSESPTLETGLEISLQISNKDLVTFTNTCRSFVNFSASPIVFHNFQEQHVPFVPENTISRNGFSFRVFKLNRSFKPVNDFIVKMGDVSYLTTNLSSFLGKVSSLNDDLIMIADIPIGKMSLPISRENFESTPNNQRVLEDVRKALVEIFEEDIKSIKPMNLQELLDDRLNHNLTGKIFNIKKRDIYKDVYPVIVNIGACNSSSFEKINGKYLVSLIPNKESANYWKQKLTKQALVDNKNYYFIGEDFLNRLEINREKLNEFFEFKKVKSKVFNVQSSPRAPKSDPSKAYYGVRHHIDSWRSKYERLTALQLHNKARVRMGLSEAEDEQQAKKQMSAIQFSEFQQLNYFTIIHSPSAKNDIASSGCKQMCDNLYNLGWFKQDSAEYNAHAKKITDLVTKQAERNASLEKSQFKFLELSTQLKLKQSLVKKDKYIKCYAEKIKRIESENSLRSRMLRLLKNGSIYSFHDSPKITRSELRKILNLK